MRRVMVRYRVKPGRGQENEDLVRDVFAELEESRAGGFGYATYRAPDGLTFVHLARFDTQANPLEGTDAFARFLDGIGERCDEPPLVTELHEVASYGAQRVLP